MSNDEIKSRYYEWMYSVAVPKSMGPHYHALMQRLNRTMYWYIKALDQNRATDGVMLRYKFVQLGLKKSVDRAFDIVSRVFGEDPPSVLEVLVALAIRCETSIMSNGETNRTAEWFWNMIVSLDLHNMDNRGFDEAYVNMCVNGWLLELYNTDGSGGLFTLTNPKDIDMRQLDIWKQMNAWLIEYTNN